MRRVCDVGGLVYRAVLALDHLYYVHKIDEYYRIIIGESRYDLLWRKTQIAFPMLNDFQNYLPCNRRHETSTSGMRVMFEVIS